MTELVSFLLYPGCRVQKQSVFSLLHPGLSPAHSKHLQIAALVTVYVAATCHPLLGFQ
jgi:hypothetical protein